MISWERFLQAVTDPDGLKRRINQDPAQYSAVQADPAQSLFIVAGPGSGKTTVLTLRVLKLIFVDDVDPASILATTFTRKAAGELRSRILGWGDDLRKTFLADPANNWALVQQLRNLDFNRVVTGTLDSIAEQVLSSYRAAGSQPPIPLEQFVADALMLRFGLWHGRRDRDPDLQAYIKDMLNDNMLPNNKKMLGFAREVRDRFIHDQVDVSAFEAAHSAAFPGVPTLCRVIEDYHNKLTDDLVMDFASLEGEFFNRLQSGVLDRFLSELNVVLVDEYQDTNYLQEQIYFTVAHAVLDRGGSFTVVGDDDQSLYRFRGATVELFANFASRLHEACGIDPTIIYLNNNYRSTRTIVDLYKDFVDLDFDYFPARVVGKPPLNAARQQPLIEYPLLGLFRPDLPSLAHDLAVFIHDVFSGNGVTVRHLGQQFEIIKDPQRGAIGDCALLCSSPREHNSGGNPRLPFYLRQELALLQPPIQVFNPRGQEFAAIPEVAILCGLILECIDPNSQVQNAIVGLPNNVLNTFNAWRQVAQDYINSDPLTPGAALASKRPNQLARYVQAWHNRASRAPGQWPKEVPLIELVYKLITWIPSLQNDPEGLVYLEAVTRTIIQSARFVSYDATVQRDQPAADASIRANLWGIFEPLASGAIEISETLIEQLPRNRLNILSIHQSKGLEFPLVIVDVGSDFKISHRAHAFKRFPSDGGRSQRLEDAVRPHSPLANLPVRPPRDRAFDDLIRQYFVAFSRPQDVLLLVGLSDNNGDPRNIPNVGTGWTRDNSWPWLGLPQLARL